MKILFVVEHFYPYVGGAEELFLNLSTSLAKQGHEVNVVTTLHSDSIPRNEIYKGVTINRVRCGNRFLFTILSLSEVWRQAKNADFIHTTSYNSAVPSFIVGLFQRKKVLITFHEVWGKLWFRLPFYPKWKLTGFYLFEWFILKLPFYKYVAVSEFTKNSLIENGIPENKIQKIYNGIDYTEFKIYRHQEPANFTFCYFGRLGISKGIDLLLEATRLFTNNHPNAKLKLIIPTYPDSLYKKVIGLIHALHLESNIFLLHNLSREDLLKEVSRSSCVIIPSASEGFCFVAVESAAMGIPIISSGKGALPETVSGKQTIIKSLDTKGILESLEKAINNEWSYEKPKNFFLEESMQEYMSLYSQLK